VSPAHRNVTTSRHCGTLGYRSATNGSGGGSTTFNAIDKRRRVSAGKDDMGGRQRRPPYRQRSHRHRHRARLGPISIQNNGGGAAHALLQPTVIVN
jgi:hypothetical protein